MKRMCSIEPCAVPAPPYFTERREARTGNPLASERREKAVPQHGEHDLHSDCATDRQQKLMPRRTMRREKLY